MPRDFGLEYYNEFDRRQGIVHIIGPEQGFTLPGTTIVCGDSHTCNAWRLRCAGLRHRHIGSRACAGDADADPEEVEEHARDRRWPIACPASPAKDIILAIIGEIGTAGGTGYALEYAGEAIRAISMEGRMTICNMSIEGGARAGMVAPDEKTYEYLKGRPKAPKGADWDNAIRYWDSLRTDDGAFFDAEIRLDAAKLPPLVTWGTKSGRRDLDHWQSAEPGRHRRRSQAFVEETRA